MSTDLLGRPADFPDWYTPSRYTPRNNRRVKQGLHPFGDALGPEGTSCGTCRHCVRLRCSRTYLKCELSRITSGPATDLRAKWRGCINWDIANEAR